MRGGVRVARRSLKAKILVRIQAPQQKIYFMKKRVFIVHGWDGSPSNCWFPWLQRELQKRGCAVSVLSMPHPEIPTIVD